MVATAAAEVRSGLVPCRLKGNGDIAADAEKLGKRSKKLVFYAKKMMTNITLPWFVLLKFYFKLGEPVYEVDASLDRVIDFLEEGWPCLKMLLL